MYMCVWALKLGWTCTGSRNSDGLATGWGIGGSFQPANSVSHFSVIEYAQPPGQGCFSNLWTVFYAATEVDSLCGKVINCSNACLIKSSGGLVSAPKATTRQIRCKSKKDLSS